MVHSFQLIRNKNGNTTVQFYQDNKVRNIIFQANTEAHAMINIMIRCYEIDNDPIDLETCIKRLRTRYLFKANVNNKSIFRPIDKKLILN